MWLQSQEKAKEPPKPKQSTYANPLNWRAGRTILLVHNVEGPLGLFVEYFHSKSPTARRLLPAQPGAVASSEERVQGDWWLHPKNSAPISPEESDEEIRQIISRFNELLDQFLEPFNE
ncbi:unnamed protein product [Sphagnum balticum]